MATNQFGLSRRRDRRTAAGASRLGMLEMLEKRCLLSVRPHAGLWTITGDHIPHDPDDQIVIDRDPQQPSMLRATVNGTVIGRRPETRVRGFRIVAGNGSDTVTIDETVARILIPASVYGGAGDDVITGGSGRDSLEGGVGTDTVRGGDGNDRLRGGTGANRLEGGGGSDNVRGGPGNDTVWGGSGNDRLEGLGGHDRMHGGDGNDTVLGGLGNDTLAGDGDDVVQGDAAAALRPSAARRTGVDRDRLDGGGGDNVLVGTDGEDTMLNGRPPERLVPITSCDDVAQHFAELAQKQYSWYFDGAWGGVGRPDVFMPLGAALTSRLESFAADNGSSARPATNADGAPTFSGTNTQEQGVDEADIVKTDGSFIHVLRGEEYIIVDAVPADSADVISRTRIEGYPIDMFLLGQRAMIFSSVYPEVVEASVQSFRPIWDRGTPQVKITVFDLSDASAPRVMHESFLDGSYINSRMIDGQVYVILSNAPRFPVPWVLAAEDGESVETPDHFEKRLAAIDPNTFLPRFRSIDYTAAGTAERTGDLLVDCSGLYRTPDVDWMNLTTVLSFDLDAEAIGGPLDSATVFGHVNTVYASADNLYLINQTWHSDGAVAGIHKLGLGADIRLEASGEVPGSVLNQFSLDEQGPYFRIATTTQSWDPDTGRTNSANNIYVLAEEEETLNVVGSLEGLAPDERIFAARFFDDHGFVVTFRQVDPLFAIDLADPTDPRVAGELHVNGFSRYLHPVDETHLLAIGRDADETGRPLGLQVSLFDVSDLNNPTRVDQYLIQPEGGWSWSEAEWNHHAFSYFPESGVMAVPVQGSILIPAEDDGDPSTTEYPTWEQRSDFWVFQVDIAGGFDLLGLVEHDSTTLRSLRIHELLYTLAHDDIKAQPLLDPTATIAHVSLE